MLKQFNTLPELMNAFRRQQTALNHFKKIRWKNGAFCPHCRHPKIYKMKPRDLYRCAGCKKNFSVLVGTIFENTKLPLKIWFGAIWLITNHPKGVASTTLARDLGITQKSAWFILHRLRYAARTRSFNAPLKGKVEVDETYVGGKARNKHGRRSGKGGGTRGKVPVVGAVERQGEVRAKVLQNATQPALEAFITENVSPKVEMLVTDAHPAYRSIFGFPQHEVVNHNKGEWRKRIASPVFQLATRLVPGG